MDESWYQDSPDADERSAHLRVLVADDNETVRLLTICHLGKAGCRERDMLVECAADGAEALEIIRRKLFALVVLDGNMPRLDGGNVLRAMREDGMRVPVVVVSGQSHETIANDLSSMAASFVNKDELDPISFGRAISESMQLQEGSDQNVVTYS